MPGAEGAPPPKKLKIAGHRDKAIERCRDWHCSQVDDPNWKMEFHAIASLTLRARLSLDRLFEAETVMAGNGKWVYIHLSTIHQGLSAKEGKRLQKCHRYLSR
jgi:hypothetical protein